MQKPWVCSCTRTQNTHTHRTREHARSTYTEHTRLSQDSETNGSTTNKGSEVKNLPTQETQVWPLGQEGPLEEEMTAPSSILAWEIPWSEEPGWLQSMGLKRVGHNLGTKQQQRQRQTRQVDVKPWTIYTCHWDGEINTSSEICSRK